MMDKSIKISFDIILHAGNAKSLCMKANVESRKYHFDEAEKLIEEAIQEMTLAHKIQTELIQNECDGNGINISLILIHAQDHINNAMQTKENSMEFLTIYKKLQQLEGDL